MWDARALCFVLLWGLVCLISACLQRKAGAARFIGSNDILGIYSVCFFRYQMHEPFVYVYKISSATFGGRTEDKEDERKAPKQGMSFFINLPTPSLFACDFGHEKRRNVSPVTRRFRLVSNFIHTSRDMLTWLNASCRVVDRGGFTNDEPFSLPSTRDCPTVVMSACPCPPF